MNNIGKNRDQKAKNPARYLQRTGFQRNKNWYFLSDM